MCDKVSFVPLPPEHLMRRPHPAPEPAIVASFGLWFGPAQNRNQPRLGIRTVRYNTRCLQCRVIVINVFKGTTLHSNDLGCPWRHLRIRIAPNIGQLFCEKTNETFDR